VSTVGRLRLYGHDSDSEELGWDWVEDQLRGAGTYWVVPLSEGHPHPRPVWGVWRHDRLNLSIGTPANSRSLAADPSVTVHLDSGTDVVIVEGTVQGSTEDAAVVADYDSKYDYRYDLATYGALTVVRPMRVLAWRSAGWAGREGFRQTGRWSFA
jgi:hypothetical protein